MTYDMKIINDEYDIKSSIFTKLESSLNTDLNRYPDIVFEYQKKYAEDHNLDSSQILMPNSPTEAKENLQKFLENISADKEEGQRILKDIKQIRAKLQTIMRFTEFFGTYHTFSKNMHKFKTSLETLLQESKTMKANDKLQIQEYTQAIENLLVAYQNMKLADCIGLSPLATIQALVDKLKSREFSHFKTAMSESILYGDKIQSSLTQYKDELGRITVDREKLMPPNFYTIMPFQYFLKMPLFFRDLQKSFESEGDADAEKEHAVQAFDLADHYSQSINKEKAIYDEITKGVLELNGKDKELKVFLLRSILELHLNSPLQTIEAIHYTQNFFSPFIKELIHDKYKSSPEVLAALGVSSLNDNFFEFSKYNPALLNDLYIKTKDPLWLVLKSTLEVNDKFTPKDKIETYIMLSELFYNGELGKTEKYYGALNMAQDTYAIAQRFPQRELVERAKESFNFSSTKDQAKYKDHAKAQHFGSWILAKINKKIAKGDPSSLSAKEICEALQNVNLKAPASKLHPMVSMLRRKPSSPNRLEHASAAETAPEDKHPPAEYESSSSSDNSEYISLEGDSDDDYLVILPNEPIEQTSDVFVQEKLAHDIIEYLEEFVSLRETNRAESASVDHSKASIQQKTGLAPHSRGFFASKQDVNYDRKLLERLRQVFIGQYADDIGNLKLEILRFPPFQKSLKDFIKDERYSGTLNMLMSEPSENKVMTPSELLDNLTDNVPKHPSLGF